MAQRKGGDYLLAHLRERILHVLYVWEPRTSDQGAQHVVIFPDNQAASFTFIFPFPVSCLPTITHARPVCPSSNLECRLSERQVRSPRPSETLVAHKQQRILHPSNWVRGRLRTTEGAQSILSLSLGIFSEDKNHCFDILFHQHSQMRGQSQR
jgi:hypothetical protein